MAELPGEFLNQYRQELLTHMRPLTFWKNITILFTNYGRFDSVGLDRFQIMVNLIEANTKVNVCRDPDDDKFLGCAIDSKALYIVSGDKDLLTLEKYKDIEIITAREFCNRYLP